MGICAFQKTTLLDFPGKVAATVFIGGCDFRCPFCHNSSIVAGGGPSKEAELMRHLEKRRGLLDGVVITGGEPTLWKGLLNLIEKIKDMGYSVKLDTNGNHPDVLEQALLAGVDYVAMDIKSSLKGYPSAVGRSGFDTKNVERSAAMLMEGKTDYEFRTTVVDELHTWKDFMDISEWLRGAKRFFLQSFVDNGSILCGGGLSAAPLEKMEKYAEILKRTIPVVELRGV